MRSPSPPSIIIKISRKIWALSPRSIVSVRKYSFDIQILHRSFNVSNLHLNTFVYFPNIRRACEPEKCERKAIKKLFNKIRYWIFLRSLITRNSIFKKEISREITFWKLRRFSTWTFLREKLPPQSIASCQWRLTKRAKTVKNEIDWRRNLNISLLPGQIYLR